MITAGYLARHAMGRSGMTGVALLDVAQDYALFHLHQQQIFDLGVVLKAGTSLRKFRAGNAGRFSTDLDFAVPDPDVGELVLDTLHNTSVHDVTFAIVDRSPGRGVLEVDTSLGRPDIPARIETSSRPLWLSPEHRRPVELPVHQGYEFALPPFPSARP